MPAMSLRQSKSMLQRVAVAAGLALIGATAATLAARGSWFCDLFSHFRWQYVLAGFVIIPLLWGCSRRWLALVCAAALVVHLYALSAQRFGRAVGALPRGLPLRVLSLNVLYKSRDYAALIDLVERQSPDVLCLYETTPAWREHLVPLTRQFAFSLFTGNGPHTGIACMSRRAPMRVVPPTGDANAAAWMRLDYEIGGTPIAVFGTHLFIPVTPEGAARRNRQLLEFARELRSISGPVIVVGDFNVSPYSPRSRDFVTTSALQDCSVGRPQEPTWPTDFPLLGIQIDRCFVSAGVGLAHYRLGPTIGSDHYPLIVDFVVGASDIAAAAAPIELWRRPSGQ
jgi:endonuclease/exonuclease/phosphatase (EEP) superfamily protein YafD